jgi:hypothetical protein
LLQKEKRLPALSDEDLYCEWLAASMHTDDKDKTSDAFPDARENKILHIMEGEYLLLSDNALQLIKITVTELLENRKQIRKDPMLYLNR